MWPADEGVTAFLKKYCSEYTEKIKAQMKMIDPNFLPPSVFTVQWSALPEKFLADLKFFVIDGMHRTMGMMDLWRLTKHIKYR